MKLRQKRAVGRLRRIFGYHDVLHRQKGDDGTFVLSHVDICWVLIVVT